MEQEQKLSFFVEPNAPEQQDANVKRILKVRLDKWLWAARFFKTRAVARIAVEKGKVFYNGERSRPSREIEVGATLRIQHGHFEKNIIIKGLSTRRRSTGEAIKLFEETQERCSTQSRNSESNFTHSLNASRERGTTGFLRRSFVHNNRHQKALELEASDSLE